jgi:hypothetical protein
MRTGGQEFRSSGVRIRELRALLEEQKRAFAAFMICSDDALTNRFSTNERLSHATPIPQRYASGSSILQLLNS